MRYKLLGNSGLRVSELGLGTMTFMDDLSWGTTREQSWQIFDAFAEAGGNFIDTSNSYGTSERYLGELIKAERDRFVVATKYTGSARGEHVNGSGNHRKSLVASVESSIRRLQTDHLDLLWLNAWDFMTPVEEIMRALDDLVRLGKVLYVGASNAPAWFVAAASTLAAARGWTRFIAVEVLYNLLERDGDRELLPMARTLDIGVTAWTPLASGWLTGKYRKPPDEAPAGTPAPAGRLDGPGASRFVRRDERAVAILDEVVRVAGELGCSPAQVALNWLRYKDVIPFFGARTAEQAGENLRCLEVTLPDEQARRLDQVSDIALGYPHDFLASGMVKQHIHGGWFGDIDDHRGATDLIRSRSAVGGRSRAS
ncbi:aldo/keto reductase [Rugosimonospora acidiphila]|uniref:Aldo/keto reductase n=1 Tax=Rugosimonospora acidiphila TaxID=556531 RepID=A0ABP9RKQ7_9ACTN